MHMSTLAHKPSALATGWYHAEDCRLAELREVVEETTRLADHPRADAVVQNVLVYGRRLVDAVSDPEKRRVVQAELASALLEGPGIVVFKHAFDPTVVDA